MSVMLLSACGGEEETTTTAAPTETTAAPTETTAAPTETTAAPTETTAAAGGFDGELNIGAVITLTGGGAMGGAEMKWAYDKAAADINAAGGVDVGGKKMEISLKYVDDKSDAVEAAAAVEKLVKVEGLKLILSTQVTPINMAAGRRPRSTRLLPRGRDLDERGPRQKYKWASDALLRPLRKSAKCPSRWWNSSLKPTGPPSGAS